MRLCSQCALVLLFQWHRTPTTQETDGFQVKRPGDVSVRCTLLLMLDYQVRVGVGENRPSTETSSKALLSNVTSVFNPGEI